MRVCGDIFSNFRMDLVGNSSPIICVDRNLPRRTVDDIRIEEKRRYRDELKDAVAISRARVDRLMEEINIKSQIPI